MLPKRVCHTLQKCKAEATSEQPASKPNRNCSPRKIDVTRKLPVGSISVVTLIRTDTTLDHSQKAEKVWAVVCKNPPIQNTEKKMQLEMCYFAFPVVRLMRRVLAACFFQNISFELH